MANKTIFQKLTDVVIGSGNGMTPMYNVSSYNIPIDSGDDVLMTFDNQEARDKKLLQLKQQKLLSYQWGKIGYDTTTEQLAGGTQVKVMYRDADLMDAWPEIGATLDTVSEEATVLNDKNKMLNIYSKSERIKAVLEDLFVNRLDINIMLPMIVRATAKYGNEFMFINVTSENGILGWRELPVYQMTRVENGIINGYAGANIYSANAGNLKPDEVKFIWEGHNESIPYKNWQVAHFRLIKDSLYIPYGVSYLNKARRHWRMLSMMEDAMLLYRLERSVERRVFKVNVGLIGDEDIPAYLQDFMSNVKRAPIIDPKTGQIDLRKNFLDVSADYVIPVKSGQDPSSIDTLQAAQNATSMEDINYMQNKVLTALRVPKAYLNFQDSQNKGQNLSILDIRFCRVINSIQQSIVMELNKIAIIHLYLLGFEDDLTNFTLSLNNPSNQIEMMILDNLQKKLGAASTALAETGNGIPLMSWHQVQKEIMGRTDAEIADMLNEMRLEFAIASELQLTTQIIKKTGLFKEVDRIYGEPGAQYSPQPQGEEGGPLSGGGGGIPPIGGGNDFGDSLGDLGEPNSDEMGNISGEEEMSDLNNIENNENNMSMESIHNLNGRKILTENQVGKQMFFDAYLKMIKKEPVTERVNIIDKAFIINETLNNTIDDLEHNMNKNINKNEIK